MRSTPIAVIIFIVILITTPDSQFYFERLHGHAQTIHQNMTVVCTLLPLNFYMYYVQGARAAGAAATGVVGGAVGAVTAVPAVLSGVGFTASGVAGGSIAAGIQAGI